MQNLTGKSESSFVQNLAKGNLLAFNCFYNGRSRRLYHFEYRSFKSEGKTNDTVQEVFKIARDEKPKLKSSQKLTI